MIHVKQTSKMIKTRTQSGSCGGGVVFLQMADDDPSTFAIPEGADLQVPEVKYEYLDHTADVQLHAWGTNLQEAFENVAAAMFGYMTDIETVDMEVALDIEAEGDDVDGLLFHFLDEFLFSFSAEPFFIPRKIEILNFDLDNFKIKARGYGEPFDISKHPQVFYLIELSVSFLTDILSGNRSESDHIWLNEDL